MLSSFTVDALGVLCLALFGVFYWLGIFATARAILAFVGTCLIGTAGFLGSGLQAVTAWLVGLANSGTSWATGLAVGGAVVTIVTAVVFAHDLMPKHQAGKRTGWAGVLLAALLISGVSGISMLNNVPGHVRDGVTNVRTILGG